MRRLLAFLRARLAWIVLLALVLGGAGGYRYYQQRQAEQAAAAQIASLRTETIARGDIVALVSATGSIQPEQQTSVFFSTPGTVADVLVDSGDMVLPGQLLARLDDTAASLAVSQALDALTVAQVNRDKLFAGASQGEIDVARANLRSANAAAGDLRAGAGQDQVSIAQIKYDSAYADYKQLADDYNNLVQFAKDHPDFAPPQSNILRLKGPMESAFFAAEVARVQLEAAKKGGGQGQLSVAYAQILQAQTVLSQTLASPPALQIEQAQQVVRQAATALQVARQRLAQTVITAPYMGIVASVNVKAGEPAGPGAPALTLIDDSRFHLDVTVDEVDVAQLEVGQGVSIMVEALPGVALNGRVGQLAPIAAVQGGLVNYTVRLLLDPTEALLRTGMSATAQVVVAEVHDVVLVPNWAIRRDRRTGQVYASLEQNESLVEVPIVSGLRGESYTEARSGVAVGDVAAISTQRQTIDLLGGRLMSLVELLRTALRSLAANKLRAALTMLGIIIGVAAVITLLSVGKGVEQYVTSQFQGIGSNLLFVFPGGPDEQSGPTEGAGRDRPLTMADGAALSDPYQVPDGVAAALEYLSFGKLELGRQTMNVQVSGVSTNYQEVRQFFVQDGNFITEADERSAARVAVIGQTVIKTLFPDGEYPVGQTIKINELPFKIVGTLQSKGGSLFGDQDSIVLVPLSTAQQRLFNARAPDGQLTLSIIYVQAASDSAMEAVAREITAVLRDRHRIEFRNEDDFTVVTQNDLISAFGEVTGVLTIFLGAIAGISLLVGGIGIMNIMLVSVTERTREIGLRKAVGARRRDILVQFLFEATLMSLLGGLVGIAIGAAGSQGVASFQPDLPVSVTADSVLLATGFSAAIGLFFGIYPAIRASGLSPIDALRYE